MSKKGVYYGVRPVQGGFGIHVFIYHADGNTTEDMNTCPWPTPAIAHNRAMRAAMAAAEREGLKVRGVIVGDARGV
jgi:hypothetical protein